MPQVRRSRNRLPGTGAASAARRTLAGLGTVLFVVVPAAAHATVLGQASGASRRAVSPRSAGPYGLIPVRGLRVPGTGAASAVSNVTYHGGYVMRTNTVYAIYWHPAGTTFGPGYVAGIDRYFSDVAAASGSPSNVYAVDTQYYDTTGPIAYESTFGGSWVDTSTPIPSSCSLFYRARGYTVTGCLTNADVLAEISRAIAANGWTETSTSIFFVFTPKDVGSCGFSPYQCAYTEYCGYHATGAPVAAYIPYPDATDVIGRSGCDSGEHPNGSWADAAVNEVSHEQNEAITDPQESGWYEPGSSPPLEIGDLCAWQFGSVLGSTADGEYNQVINGDDYYIAQEWSNASSSCALGYAPPPTISGFGPGSAAPGAEVTIGGSHLTGASAVTFDGVSARFTVRSDTEVDATVPPGAMAGPVEVTTPGGTATSSASFVVLPAASTGVSATAGETQATVSFTPPADTGGLRVTSYTVTASPGGQTATGAASPITITGLTLGVTYTFTVTATTSAGAGPASAPSNAVVLWGSRTSPPEPPAPGPMPTVPAVMVPSGTRPPPPGQ